MDLAVVRVAVAPEHELLENEEEDDAGEQRLEHAPGRQLLYGYLLAIGRDLNNMGLVIAIMGVIVGIGLLFDRLVFGPLESWVANRWGVGSD